MLVESKHFGMRGATDLVEKDEEDNIISETCEPV